MQSKSCLFQDLFRTSLFSGVLLFPLLSHKAWAEGIPPGRVKAIDSVLNGTWKAREQEAEKICAKVLSIPFPVKDQPSATEIQELKGCDSYELYYGFDKPSDPVRARKCAYLEKEHPNTMWGGAPVLMMIYANGKGIERNLNLALRIACGDKDDTSLAEHIGRIEHLNKIQQEKITNEPFDYCDDITRGFSQGECAGKESRFAGIERTKRLEKLTKSWSGSDKQAYKILLAAWGSYRNAREGEVDQSGTARAAMLIEDDEVMESGFQESLLKFERGVFPRFTDSDFAKADQELNLVYKNIQESNHPNDMGTVTKDDIKKAQRAWLKFRDAWVIFAKQKYPSVATAAWKTWLTKDRTKLLQDSFEF